MSAPTGNRAVALVLVCMSAAAGAQVGPLDTTFGDGGMRHYGFQAVSGGVHDRAVVACSAADGTLTVVGTASSERRIVTMRLKRDGSYDTSFSGDGKESFDLPGSYADFTPGACQADGHLVVARSLTAPDGEQSLQIFRVLKHTGLPDPGFGSGGVVSVDLDQWASGLGKEEMPLGVNQLPNGDLAVSGRATLAGGGTRGFVVLLNAAGTGRAVRVLDEPARTATTVVESPDARLWVFGQLDGAGGAYRATVQRNSLAPESLTPMPAPAGETLWVGAGRSVDAQTVVLAASRGPAPAYDGWPALIVFRASGATLRSLPMPALDGQQLVMSPQFGSSGVTVLPQRRVLYGGTVHRYGDTARIGLHFAMAEIGSAAAGDRIDTTFAIGGAQTAAFRPPAPGCSGQTPYHAPGRLTLWGQQPVFVGAADAACAVPGAGEDYLVARIQVDPIFADGFD